VRAAHTEEERSGMKDTAPLVYHYQQEGEEESVHVNTMSGRENENETYGKNDYGERPEVGGVEGALGLLFLQQMGGGAPGHPRGDITQAITLRIP
jgi:hypothetical protein